MAKHISACAKKKKSINYHSRDTQTQAHDQYTSVSQDDEHMSEFLMLSHMANKTPVVRPPGRCQHTSRQPDNSWQSLGKKILIFCPGSFNQTHILGLLNNSLIFIFHMFLFNDGRGKNIHSTMLQFLN